MGQKESIVGFIGKDFEVYAVLSPLAFMPLIVDCLDRIIIWSKRKEKTLFALDKDTLFVYYTEQMFFIKNEKTLK